MITKQHGAEKIAAWLRHEITQGQLVAWAEEAIREGDFPEADAPELAQVVGRLGLADVKDFGLAWDDCEALLKSLGFTAKVEITAASIAHAAGVAAHAGQCRRDVPLCHAEAIEEKQMKALALHERVALKRDLKEHQLRAGDVAYLVDFVPHPTLGDEGAVIEVFNVVGESIAVATVPLSELEPLAGDDVLAVRRRNVSGAGDAD